MLEIVRNYRVSFSEVAIGEVFTFEGEDVYLKIHPSDTDDDGYYKNAVSLGHFELVTFYEDDMITICPYAKLTIS